MKIEVLDFGYVEFIEAWGIGREGDMGKTRITGTTRWASSKPLVNPLKAASVAGSGTKSS